jgi:hypothetical protein
MAAVNGLNGGVNSDDPFGGVFPTAQLAQLEPATIELAAKIFSTILSDVLAGRPAQHSVANVRAMMLMETTARLSEQLFRVDKWSFCRVRLPCGEAAGWQRHSVA